ncbi:MAG: phospholipase D-like domain-containing protein [candidate division WOR-3 bacterium]
MRKRIRINKIFLVFLTVFILSISSIFRSCKFEKDYELVQYDSFIKVLFTRYDDIIPNIKFYIENAKSSIYLAVFEIGNEELARALISAKRRGIDVKIVTDEQNADYKALKELINNKIDVVFQNLDSYMHHKFAVIDSQIVITGSMNWTDNDILKNDNNVLIISSRLLANNYLSEFSQMFHQKRFSREKVKIGNNVLEIDGIRIENYFSPQDKPSIRIVQLINSAKKTIDFAAFSFTHDKIGNAMISAYKRNVKVRGLFEKRQVSKFSEYERFKEQNMEVYLDSNPRNMHNKFIIIDSQIVITGSYNFSSNADNRNDENVIIIFSRDISLRYLKYLDRLIYSDKQSSLYLDHKLAILQLLYHPEQF